MIEIRHMFTGEVLVRKGTIHDSESLAKMNLSFADCSYMDLNHAGFFRSNCSFASFAHSDLSQAYMNYAELSNASFQYANLTETSFLGANLQGADLRDANVRNAMFFGADLRGARLPAPAKMLQAKWGLVSYGLCADLMEYDAYCHGDRKAFDEWAKGGPCPYRDGQVRAANFWENRELWGKGKLCSPYDLLVRVLREKCITDL